LKLARGIFDAIDSAYSSVISILSPLFEPDPEPKLFGLCDRPGEFGILKKPCLSWL
jgi:hypothetical protein